MLVQMLGDVPLDPFTRRSPGLALEAVEELTYDGLMHLTGQIAQHYYQRQIMKL
jgi:hypothetical protein